MELREYIQLIKKYKIIFFATWLAVIALATGWAQSRPKSYDVSMAVEVARDDQEQTDDYQFDQYYRLEADNKFSDTVVQWLKDPAVVHVIYSDAGLALPSDDLQKLAKTFRVEKLSSNYIQVRYAVTDPQQAEKLWTSADKMLNARTGKLNHDEKNDNWFHLLLAKPLVAPAKVEMKVVVVMALIGGFLVALVTVLVKHYWQD